NRAQKSFRIEKCVPLFPRQILEVEVVREIVALVEFPSHKVSRSEKKLLRSRPGSAVSDRRRIRRASIGKVSSRFLVARLRCQASDIWSCQPNISNRRETHQRPIAQQQPRANTRKRPRLEKTEKQACKKIRQCDPIQHTH